MKIKRVVTVPDPRLRAPNADVTETWPQLEERVRQMFKVMYEHHGCGLAAPQVGWNVKLFIADPDWEHHKPENRIICWNPRLEWVVADGTEPMEEGCLSAPGQHGRIMRHKTIRLIGTGPKGPIDTIFRGYPAQIVQHEMGHLYGELCIDKYCGVPA